MHRYGDLKMCSFGLSCVLVFLVYFLQY